MPDDGPVSEPNSAGSALPKATLERLRRNPAGGRDGRLGALLIDVGGTLVSDLPPAPPGVREVRVDRLAALLPGLDRDAVGRLLDDLRAGHRAERGRLDQRTDAMIAERLASVDPSLAGRAAGVREALGRPTGQERPAFPGHRDLLLAAGELGMRRVLVTNTNWVSDDDWPRWWLAARDME